MCEGCRREQSILVHHPTCMTKMKICFMTVLQLKEDLYVCEREREGGREGEEEGQRGRERERERGGREVCAYVCVLLH